MEKISQFILVWMKRHSSKILEGDKKETKKKQKLTLVAAHKTRLIRALGRMKRCSL